MRPSLSVDGWPSRITSTTGTGGCPAAHCAGSAGSDLTGLLGPIGLAVDAVGNLLITDSVALHEGLGTNERVLKVFGVAAPGLIAGEPFPSP